MPQVTVSINGRIYRVGCDDGQEQAVGDLARDIDRRIDSYKSSFGEVGDMRLKAGSAGARPCRVTIRLKNSETFSIEKEHAKGSPEVPMSAEELRRKFSDCAHQVLDHDTAERARDSIERLESLSDIRERLDVPVGLADHEMQIERHVRHAPDGPRGGRTERDVRHEMAVHDVEVKPVGSGIDHGAHIRFQVGKVTGEDRRSDFDHGI